MKQNFKLVILDYPKLLLDNEAACRAFGDMIQSKQQSFERTSETYVTLGQLDMISTHVMIYDTSAIFKPKPVLAIRICYRQRAKKHGLSLPIDDYYKIVPPDEIKKYETFRDGKRDLVDCNSWFVDPDYTFSKTKIPLSDMGFFAAAMFILRKGNDHMVGCTNEQYKASRWINEIGHLMSSVTFTHPKMQTPHQFLVVDGFRPEWLMKCADSYEELWRTGNEFIPEATQSGDMLLGVEEVLAQIRANEQSYRSAA